MIKIVHRPDPPPPEVDSNRAVRKTDTFLNREASAGLFKQALVKAEGQEQAEQRSSLADSGLDHQIESDADSLLGARTRESLLGSQNETHGNNHNTALEASDTTELQHAADDAAEVDNAAVEEKNDADSDERGAESVESPTGLDASAAYQMFENIRDLNSSADSGQQADTNADDNATPDSVSNEQHVNATVQAAGAYSGATATSLESRVESMPGLSDLIDMLESSIPLAEGNEWTLILEDDGPVSELTLSSDKDGQWNIDLRTSFDNDSVDEEMIGNLRSQLKSAGIAVANIALVDSAPADGVTNNTV